jgi:calcineurin-like phosphoesterase family protein
MHWFTGDEHFGHKAIMRYCDRPFKNVDVMMERIIYLHNQLVQPGDTVWHLGDFIWYGPDRNHYYRLVMKKYKEGVTHHLVLGNHDSAKPFMYVDVGFATVHTAITLNIEGLDLVLAHDPAVYCATNKEAILICGHVHTLFKVLPKERVVNVGVDMWDFSPVSLEQIRSLF